MSAKTLQLIIVCVMSIILGFLASYVIMKPSLNAHWQKELTQDTHGKIQIEGPIIQEDGIHIVRMKTPRGPEVAYLIAHEKYLAIGPLMNLKSGKNITPVLEHKYAAS